MPCVFDFYWRCAFFNQNANLSSRWGVKGGYRGGERLGVREGGVRVLACNGKMMNERQFCGSAEIKKDQNGGGRGMGDRL